MAGERLPAGCLLLRAGLLQPLEKEGVLVKRSRNELEAMMHDFIVIERETKVSGGRRQGPHGWCWQGHHCHILC